MIPHNSMLAIFNLGTPEIILIGVVALLLFGSRLPEVMRGLGKGVVEFKKGLRDVQDEVERSSHEPPAAPPPSSNSQPLLTSTPRDDAPHP